MTGANKHSDEAAAWFARLKRPASSEAGSAEFSRWLAEDAENQRAFSHIVATWDELEEFAEEEPILALRESAKAYIADHRHSSRIRLALAASVALLMIGGSYMLLSSSERTPEVPELAVSTYDYRTEQGQLARITMADGSEMVLDADSQVHVRLSDTDREVSILQGRALFTVAPDKARPFVVSADGVAVTAVGTQFSVSREDLSVRVVLAEGRVRLNAGGQSSLDMIEPSEGVAFDGMVSVRAIDPSVANSWTSGKLVFENATLAEIGRGLSRYTRKPIVIAPALADERMSIVLGLRDVPGFLEAAENLGYGHVASSQSTYRLDP